MGGCQVHLWELYKKYREVPPDSQNVYFLESISVKFHQDQYKEIRGGTLRSRPPYLTMCPCRIIVFLMLQGKPRSQVLQQQVEGDQRPLKHKQMQ